MRYMDSFIVKRLLNKRFENKEIVFKNNIVAETGGHYSNNSSAYKSRINNE